MENLIPMTDFVLQKHREAKTFDDFTKNYLLIVRYMYFLKLRLKLGMFVPRDGQGNVLKKPNPEDYNEETNGFYFATIDYQEAREKCLFKDFEISYTIETRPTPFLFNSKIGCNVYLDPSFGVRHNSIEDLVELNLELTKEALNELEYKL